MGGNSHWWTQHPNFAEYNANAKRKLLLNENDGEQYDLYDQLLNNLLQIDKGIINIDFINNFYRYIYYDFDGSFIIIRYKCKFILIILFN